MLIDLNSISALNGAIDSGANSSKPSKLHAAAQQFEALVIGEMLRSERESSSDAAGSGGWLGAGEDSGSDSAMDLAEGHLSNALAAGGGLGLARMIEKTMTHADSPSRSAASVSIKEPG
jgi:Rod binding domain-containing protein